MTGLTDTIVAAATPPGTGGVGVVRVSGEKVEQLARALLGSLPEPRFAAYRAFRNTKGQKLDAGLALYFPAPSSFTGESVLELHGHGGPLLISLLVEAIVEMGARRAEPGEFSQRAFLNNKLDLTQAEAIADLISAGTKQAVRAALRSLSGAFSSAVDALAEQLVRVRMHLLRRLNECADAFALLQEQAQQGRVLRDGFQVVIVGKPNAGKSSLLNLLSGQDAAIVTEVAGTTRDILREQIDIDGLAVELVDTAGLRENPDRVEEEGIRRARSALQSAELCTIKSTCATNHRKRAKAVSSFPPRPGRAWLRCDNTFVNLPATKTSAKAHSRHASAIYTRWSGPQRILRPAERPWKRPGLASSWPRSCASVTTPSVR